MDIVSNTHHTQHLIIGFGKAGKTLAYTLGKLGKSVILVEQSSQMYGGTCINIGCIPSKKLSFLSDKPNKVSLKTAVDKKDELIGQLNRANFDKLDNLDGVQVITGQASFLDKYTIAVATKNETLILTADNIYINTGAHHWQPPIVGLSESQFVHDSTSLMALKNHPDELIIIGGGYIGLEFAFTFAGFGSRVTILESNNAFLPKEDDDIRRSLLDIMHSKHIEVKTGIQIESVSDDDNQAIITTSQGVLTANAVLVATGRRANTHGLGLDNAGINLTDKGFIAVNEHLQTSQPHIYAMGDVAGSPQFTYISLDDYRVVKSHLLGDGSYTTKGRTFPYAVFTHPPLAAVGLTEKTAKEQGLTIKTAKLYANSIPKAKINEQTDGILKAVVNVENDEILGVQLLCENSHEMINFMDLAIRQGMTASDIANHIFTHPTMSEALNDLFGSIE